MLNHKLLRKSKQAQMTLAVTREKPEHRPRSQGWLMARDERLQENSFFFKESFYYLLCVSSSESRLH